MVSWAANEPNDVDFIEIDHYEQFATLNTLADVIGALSYGAICECDGRAISDEARAVIELYRR